MTRSNRSGTKIEGRAALRAAGWRNSDRRFVPSHAPCTAQGALQLRPVDSLATMVAALRSPLLCRSTWQQGAAALCALALVALAWSSQKTGGQAAAQQAAQVQAHEGSGGHGGGSTPSGSHCARPLSAVARRSDIGALLEREQLQTGAELGVQVGINPSQSVLPPLSALPCRRRRLATTL